MKKHGPSYGQNNQLVRWWVLVHCGQVSGKGGDEKEGIDLGELSSFHGINDFF
jgi:hypothetical protein